MELDTKSEATESMAKSPEQARFTKHSPLITLLIMSFGAVIIQAVIPALSVVNTVINSKHYGSEKFLNVMMNAYVLMPYVQLFALFLTQCMEIHICALLGADKKEDASQLYSDILRILMVVAAVLVVILSFASKSLMRLMGCNEQFIDDSFEYFLPYLLATPFIYISLTNDSFVQSIGLSYIRGIGAIALMIISVCVITPFLLFVCHIQLKLAILPLAAAQSLYALIFFILIFKGKFSLKVNLKQLISKFTPETKKAILIGFPFLIRQIAGIIPTSFIMGFIQNASKHDPKVTSVHSIYSQYEALAGGIPNGFITGFACCVSFTIGQRDPLMFKRYVRVAVIVIVITSIIISFLPVVFPKTLAKIFSDDDETIQLGGKMLPVPFFTFILGTLSTLLSTALLVMRYPTLTMIPPVIKALSLVGFFKLFCSVYPSSPQKQYLAYCCTDCLVMILTLALLVKPMKNMNNLIDEGPSSFLQEKLLDDKSDSQSLRTESSNSV